MTCISWNCCGLAATTTNRELNDLYRDHKLAIVFLMETKAHKERVERVRRKYKVQHSYCVEASGTNGGLCLLWNDYHEL